MGQALYQATGIRNSENSNFIIFFDWGIYNIVLVSAVQFLLYSEVNQPYGYT